MNSFADFEVNTSVIGSEANTFSKEKHTSIWALRNPMSIDCWSSSILISLLVLPAFAFLSSFGKSSCSQMISSPLYF